ncbi:hypothetical protein HHI36_012363 [Cryptolaemus montrouzieri]|uniref:Metaxin n=1 Tax=Cryptolaemus montrouzieri TaxID=559131 RepID=A0ABD2NFH9_9CUCU
MSCEITLENIECSNSGNSFNIVFPLNKAQIMYNKFMKYQLNVVPGDYGLVSLDPECTQSILYTRIAKVPCDIKLLSSYRVCTFYSAPSFVNGKEVFNGYDAISSHLRSIQYNLDFGLSSKQCSETMALSSMILQKLRPLLEFIMWVDKRNNEELINPWHMKVLRIPFNYYYTKGKRESATDLIEAIYDFEDNPEIIKDYLIKAATDCLTSLSSRLGKDDYFFKKSPTSLDILVYGYVSPFLKLPLNSVDITNMIKSLWPNLETFVKRIDAKYLGDLIDNERFLIRESRTQQNDDEVSYSAIIILSLSAVSLVLTFAVNKGFIKL